ncbi:MAG: VCBS repeat-containing protein [Planctomycetes bacterium]|nr:VCBS repeat-containing protein [Planctomycetota bacterium]
MKRSPPSIRANRTTVAAAIVGFGSLIPAAAGGDFNGDGFDDLTVGIPFENVDGVTNAGALQMFPGSVSGPSVAGSLLITPVTLGLLPEIESGFGIASTSADFDGDGFDDLAIGAPGVAVKGLGGAGRVYIVRGSATGLDFSIVKAFDQNTKGIKDKVERRTKGDDASAEFFGARLAHGDFNGDGYADLVISVTGERIGKAEDAGAAHVLFGSANGLTAKRNQFWHQNRKGIKGKCAKDDRFASNLAVGDLNGDGFDDLALTVPREADATPGVGRVAVLFGTKQGLRAKGNQLFKPSTELIPLSLVPSDSGLSIACGDFDADVYDDLAIGAYNEALVPGGDSRGVVYVVRGSSIGPVPQLTTAYHQGDGIVPGTHADDELFGAIVAAADFDGDGDDDLAISAVGESFVGFANGRVTVLYSSGSSGLASAGAQTFDQDTANVNDVAEAEDSFGYGLAVLDANGDGAVDLAIGIPGEDVGAVVDAGAVAVLLSALGVGVTASGDAFLHQDLPFVDGDCEQTDLFGFLLQN